MLSVCWAIRQRLSLRITAISHFSYDEEDESAPYQVYVNPNDMERIEQIYAVVAMLVEGSDSEMLYLGYDHYVDVDWEKGILSDDLYGFSLTDYSGNETLTDFVEIVLEE